MFEIHDDRSSFAFRLSFHCDTTEEKTGTFRSIPKKVRNNCPNIKKKKKRINISHVYASLCISNIHNDN